MNKRNRTDKTNVTLTNEEIREMTELLKLARIQRTTGAGVSRRRSPRSSADIKIN